MNRLQIALTTAVIALLAACQPAAAVPAPTTTPTTSVPSAPTSASADPSSSPAAPSPASSAEPTPSAAPSSSPPRADAVPPPPTAVKMSVVGSDPGGAGYDTDLTTTISWHEAVTAGTEIRVYGVTECFAPAKGGPCLVEHTALPDSVRELIAKAPASKGKVSWTWPSWDDVGGAVMAHGESTYQAVVIAAYNADGHSKFIIVRSGEWCPDCTY